jgi:hypothetical protein
MKKIQEARRRSDRVRELLEMLGDDRKIRPLATRCAGIFIPKASCFWILVEGHSASRRAGGTACVLRSAPLVPMERGRESGPVSTRPRRPCPPFFPLQSPISKGQWYYSSTRPLPSRRGFACGVAGRNDRVGGSAGQGLSRRTSAVESRDRRLEFSFGYEGLETSSAHFLVCANRHFTKFGMMG